ncbi:hypothetical protein MYXA107069_37810 [Myxococcus xanthus]
MGPKALLSKRTLRLERASPGKNARAMYWPFTLMGRTSNSTLLLEAVQLESCALTWTNFTWPAASHAPVALAMALTTAW